MSEQATNAGDAKLVFASNEAMESAALAGAAATQRLVGECSDLRTRLNAQEIELVRLRGANETMRRRYSELHRRYVELAKKILGQLEQFDGVIREIGQANSVEEGRHEQAIAASQSSQLSNGAETADRHGQDPRTGMAQA